MDISVTDPISRAYDRAILITFKPFNIGKWFVLGFVAWLATLTEGSVNFNFNSSGTSRTAPAPAPTSTSAPWTGATPGPRSAAAQWDEMKNWAMSHIPAVIVIAVVLVILLLGIGLLISWISSRGKFMFLRGVATNTAEVVAPWKLFRDLGNSLFGFMVCLWGIGLAINVIIVGVGLFIAWDDIQAKTFGSHAMTAIIGGAIFLIPTAIILGLIGWCTNSFVTVIMYATGKDVWAAWREFRENILPGHVGSMILFLLMQIVLGIGVFLGRFLLGCITCCIGFLPYLNTVIALPLIVFMRCYSIYFLQQFGPQYVIIAEAPPPAPPTGFPVIGIPYPHPPYPPQM